MGCSRWGVARVGHGWVTDHTHTPLINSELNLLDKLAATSIAALAGSPCSFTLWRGFLSRNFMNQPLLPSNFLLQFLTSLRSHRIIELGLCFGLGFGLQECCGWFELLSRSLKFSPFQL